MAPRQAVGVASIREPPGRRDNAGVVRASPIRIIPDLCGVDQSRAAPHTFVAFEAWDRRLVAVGWDGREAVGDRFALRQS